MTADDPLWHLAAGYHAEVDLSDLEPDTPTRSGLRLRDLGSIGGCALTPGDPSPIGRTPEGDLDYVLHATHDYLHLERREAALLLHALECLRRGTAEDPRPLRIPDALRNRLRDVAVPASLYPESQHGVLDRERALRAFVAGFRD